SLYLLDRLRRKKVVSTLRFWTPAAARPARRTFARVREPWSLALQLASLVLLLLAIAHLEWGTRYSGRDYALILDTSAWTAETSGGKTLLEREKTAARKYLRRLSPADRVLVLRADSLVTPATPFTSNRAKIIEAIRESATAPRALKLNRALSHASAAEHAGRNPGGLVYSGPGMISGEPMNADTLRNLRVIEVRASRQNCGIRRIAAERSHADARMWQIGVSVKNYGLNPRTVRVRAAFPGASLPPRSLALGPGEERQAEFTLKANAAGRFTADIEPHDHLAMDDRAELELPAPSRVRVSIFTDRPKALQPLFDSDERLTPVFYNTSAYRADPAAKIAVFDQFAPVENADVPALWIDTP
ncbi:MAG: vWA domain-containing protein, partial [Bryobacteraceae bacterium]